MTGSAVEQRRVEFGDWQTPDALAGVVMNIVSMSMPEAASVVEPTCGRGAFLRAASATYAGARLHGYEISESHLAMARSSLPEHVALTRADFFDVRWEAVLRELPQPILVLGNPPWVTNSTLGALDADNLPRKINFKGESGFDAMTGKSNFDISEWMILRLLEALRGLRFGLAMLCKASVARRVMERAAAQRWRLGGDVRAIDAREHFGAAVDAVLLTVRPDDGETPFHETGLRWAVYQSLAAPRAVRHMGVVNGQVFSDIDRYHETRDLEGESAVEWRSGVKHDCSRVMELEATVDGYTNASGERVALEDEFVYPLLKGSDLANGRTTPRRSVIVTQHCLGADTTVIRSRAPVTWDYLSRHREELDARKSAIYRKQPAFAIFGVGDYAFAPFKVAICGLYKRFAFALVEPVDGRPVMLDDTCYFLPCETREQADGLLEALRSDRARGFFEARVFWDAKRPISKQLLGSISLDALLGGAVQAARKPARQRQQTLGF